MHLAELRGFDWQKTREIVLTIDPKLFKELGGKKTAEKKEKLHTLKPEQKKETG